MIKSQVPLINGDTFTQEDKRFGKLMKRIEKIEVIFILPAERLTLEDWSLTQKNEGQTQRKHYYLLQIHK